MLSSTALATPIRRSGAIDLPSMSASDHALAAQLGHTKIESTVRYLGIELDDAIELADKDEI